MSRSTPEGKVKDLIDAMLQGEGLIPSSKAVNATEENTGKYHKPVSLGMGVHGIPDYYGHYKGFYFEIEAKKDQKAEPTALQKHQLNATSITGAESFVVGCEDDLKHVVAWFRRVDNFHLFTNFYP